MIFVLVYHFPTFTSHFAQMFALFQTKCFDKGTTSFRPKLYGLVRVHLCIDFAFLTFRTVHLLLSGFKVPANQTPNTLVPSFDTKLCEVRVQWAIPPCAQMPLKAFRGLIVEQQTINENGFSAVSEEVRDSTIFFHPETE